MDTVGTLSLILATLTMGLVTGAFVVFWHTIMPGLATTDDRTFVSAFQSIDKAIMNPWFMISGFVGALIFTLIATVTQFGRPTFVWIAVALVLYVIVFVITSRSTCHSTRRSRRRACPTTPPISPRSGRRSTRPDGGRGTSCG
jgi:uncharacterized membrane protein